MGQPPTLPVDFNIVLRDLTAQTGARLEPLRSWCANPNLALTTDPMFRKSEW